MHSLIVDLFWLQCANYLKVELSVVQEIIKTADENIRLNYLEVDSYSSQIVEMVALYNKHIKALT